MDSDVPAESGVKLIRHLVKCHGLAKPFKAMQLSPGLPRFFLIRPFLGDVDLAIILNTLPCRFACRFCGLRFRKKVLGITESQITEQFLWVCRRVRHAVAAITRISLSNDGSLFDEQTMAPASLECIARCAAEFPMVQRLVIESRLQLVSRERLLALQTAAPHLILDILTGFETLDARIRMDVLGKTETIDQYRDGLDIIAASGASLTAYVLFKPDPHMTDLAAVNEATSTAAFLKEECRSRSIPLSLRLNPMYPANGTPWAAEALSSSDFAPCRLTDVLAVARTIRTMGVPVHLGLSFEGLSSPKHTFYSREDFSRRLFETAKQFNLGGP